VKTARRGHRDFTFRQGGDGDGRVKRNGTNEFAVWCENVDEIVATIGDVEISLCIDVAVFTKRYGGMPRGIGRADNGELLFRGVENNNPNARRGQQIIFAILAVAQCTKAGSNQGKNAPLGYELFVHVGSGQDQGHTEKTNWRNSTEKFRECPKHGSSDYRVARPVA